MTKPITFHSFLWLNNFMRRFHHTPIWLRLPALLFLLVLAMLMEAAKTSLRQ
jgi:hypothetical protein